MQTKTWILQQYRWQESDSIRDRYTGKHIAEEKEELYYMERKFTSENFEAEVLKSEKPVLVDFYADWCGPCKMMAPAVEELANEQDDVIVGKLNVDFAPELARTYKVFSIPTLILFKNGEAVEKRVGVQSKTELEMLIK
ncbi:thioredoxin [Clostridium sp. AF32-12BH]|uniref:thioredoxin n=1 Tax=unclassified Clostridium TaxID=2614128 RepID=UPI00325AF7CF